MTKVKDNALAKTNHNEFVLKRKEAERLMREQVKAMSKEELKESLKDKLNLTDEEVAKCIKE